MRPWILLLALLALPAPAAGQVLAAGELEAEIATAEAAFPGLLGFREQEGGRVLVRVGEAPLEAIYRELEAGTFRPEIGAALRVVFQGLSRQIGTLSVEGRQILQVVAGIAAESGGAPALRGVAGILADLTEDTANPYSILAQDLLSEKIRCGAAALGEDALVRDIAARVDPDRFGASSQGPRDRRLADRYGLHQRADLYSVAASGLRVAAVGRLGTLLLSDDGGESWAAPATGTDETLFAVAFAPGEAMSRPGAVWAVGRAGTVLVAADAAPVTRRPTPFERHFFGVIAPRPAAVRVVGDFGLQLASEDAGRTWRCVPREEDVILGRIAAAGNDGFLVGEFGTLERLPRGDLPGRPGRVSGVPEDLYLFDAWFDASGERGFAVGLAGTLLRSDDAGATWTPIDSDLRADLYGVGGAGERVAVVGEGGAVSVSEDGGRHFTRLETPLPLPFHDVAFASPARAYLVGPRGLVVRLEGRTLQVVHPPPEAAP